MLPERFVADLERAEAEAFFASLRREWDSARARWNPVTGLVAEPYPPELLAPFEDRRKILAEQPAPEGRVEVDEDGTVVWLRPGLIPLEIDLAK
jgi:hypothetical protein